MRQLDLWSLFDPRPANREPPRPPAAREPDTTTGEPSPRTRVHDAPPVPADDTRPRGFVPVWVALAREPAAPALERPARQPLLAVAPGQPALEPPGAVAALGASTGSATTTEPATTESAATPTAADAPALGGAPRRWSRERDYRITEASGVGIGSLLTRRR